MSDFDRAIVRTGAGEGAPYSAAVSAGGLVYLSGTVAEDEHGTILEPGNIQAQTRIVLERMDRLLRQIGSSLDGAVSVLVHLTRAADFGTMNEVYRQFWPHDPPARTTVITPLAVPEARIEIALVAAAGGAARTVIHPSRWARSPNPYSYAVRTGETLFMSGLVPRRGRDNSAVEGDIRAQTRAVMENASELLEAGGLSFEHVVSARVYLTDASSFAGMNEVYASFFKGNYPARATVTCGLAGAGFLVEMTFTASSAPRQIIGAPPPGVPISPAVRAGRRIYLSGMLGNTPETRGNVAAQTRETLSRIAATLEAAGAGRDEVVDASVYLKDVSGFEEMNGEYRRFFGGVLPARTTVGAPLVVDDGLVEIMVTAFGR